MFKLFSGLFSGVFSKVMGGAVIAIAAVAAFLYWQNSNITKDLKIAQTNYSKLNGEHTRLKDDYAGLEKRYIQLEESKKVNEDIQTEISGNTIIYRDRFDLVNKKVGEEVAKIRKEYEGKEQTEENIKAQEAAISQVRISGLWQTFCTGNKTDKRCEAFNQ